MAMYSTSVVDRATHFCSLDCHETAPPEKVIKYPEVDFLELTSKGPVLLAKDRRFICGPIKLKFQYVVSGEEGYVLTRDVHPEFSPFLWTLHTFFNGNPSENYNEDEPFASEQDGEYDRGRESPRVEESNTYLNNQTHMVKTAGVRWSKQDTELFYEATQQFGTDFSMIQQLFPGRTRKQVKLKYQKEERQHPMRLREALSNRAKDHSHFEKVIEHLQQIAAEEYQNSNKDDSVDLTGNEDAEGTREANEEEPKSECEGRENEDMAQEFTEIQSPVKSCDSEDDLYLWSQYKSDM